MNKLSFRSIGVALIALSLSAPLAPSVAQQPASPPATPSVPVPDFDAILRLAAERGEPKLRAELISGIHLVSFAPAKIEIRLGTNAQKDLPGRLQRTLAAWTGHPWSVTTVNQGGAPTIAERDAGIRAQRVAEAKQDPAVQAVLAAFPGAEIREVRDVAKAPVPDADIPPSDEDEPF